MKKLVERFLYFLLFSFFITGSLFAPTSFRRNHSRKESEDARPPTSPGNLSPRHSYRRNGAVFDHSPIPVCPPLPPPVTRLFLRRAESLREEVRQSNMEKLMERLKVIESSLKDLVFPMMENYFVLSSPTFDDAETLTRELLYKLRSFGNTIPKTIVKSVIWLFSLKLTFANVSKVEQKNLLIRTMRFLLVINFLGWNLTKYNDLFSFFELVAELHLAPTLRHLKVMTDFLFQNRLVSVGEECCDTDFLLKLLIRYKIIQYELIDDEAPHGCFEFADKLKLMLYELRQDSFDPD